MLELQEPIHVVPTHEDHDGHKAVLFHYNLGTLLPCDVQQETVMRLVALIRDRGCSQKMGFYKRDNHFHLAAYPSTPQNVLQEVLNGLKDVPAPKPPNTNLITTLRSFVPGT